MRAPHASSELLCPSAPPQAEDARVIGIVDGTASEPRVVPLEEPLPVTPEILALVGPVDPGQVLRIAGRCAGERCRHFRDDACSLATRIARMLPAPHEPLPFCTIRAECRWFRQEGAAACQRCAQVVTRPAQPTPTFAQAADPDHALT